MAYDGNSSTWEAVAELLRGFQVSPGYKVRPSLIKQTTLTLVARWDLPESILPAFEVRSLVFSSSLLLLLPANLLTITPSHQRRNWVTYFESYQGTFSKLMVILQLKKRWCRSWGQHTRVRMEPLPFVNSYCLHYSLLSNHCCPVQAFFSVHLLWLAKCSPHLHFLS